jgi:hypothetical protein
MCTFPNLQDLEPPKMIKYDMFYQRNGNGELKPSNNEHAFNNAKQKS